MKLNCPECSKPIAMQSINVSADLGKCDYCGNVFSVSSLVKNEDIEKFLPPPSGSNIKLQKNEDNSFEILLPEKKLSSSDIFPLFFSLFWLGFVAFWTYGASQGSVFFALFSIPFWIVGITTFGSFINSLNEEHIVTVDNKGITINKNRPVNSKTYTANFEDIYSIRISNNKFSNPFSQAQNIRYAKFSSNGFEAPTINSGKESFTFFEYASEAEKDWIIDFLNKAKKRVKA